ncbi:proline transporter 2-like [Melia azedarach]|uniref:Proline transporter 2-like n=1 Tax=Melia azedarach TaxID=155640 RepID=A0ACC1XMB1_MELAZ|nr:proline transporter 2-like [Melia azedarach]
MGFILLAARALKEINSEFSDSPLRLQICIMITGVTFFIFACLTPTISAMRRWLIVSSIVTITYILILLVILVKDGKSNKHTDYEVEGSKTDKVFNALGAISALIFANSPGMLPEIQVFLQTIVSQHMFISPVHETLDTKFLKLEESMFSRENIKRRLCLRALFFTVNTFVAAAFPFMEDFVNMIGSFSLIPLTFLSASMVFIKVKSKTATMEKKAWHSYNIVLFSLLTVATTSSAVRLVIKNIQDYSFFADA